MINALLWDLGDVLCRFYPERRVQEIARRSGTSESDVRSVLTPDLLGLLDAGDMTSGQLLTAVHDRLKWDCTIEELGAAWVVAFEPNPSILNIARRVVVPAAVLTNNGAPLSDHFRDLLPAVAVLIPLGLFSGATRAVKPDPAAFFSACAALNVTPSEVLLIDDSPANVAAASRVGLQTHHFQNVELLESFMDRQHLLAPRRLR